VHVILRVAIGSLLALRNSEIELLEVTQALGEHTRCRLRFYRDNDTDVLLETLLGLPLTVTLDDEIGPTTTPFTGFVLDGSQAHQLNHGSEFELEAISYSWAMEREDTAYYTAHRLPDLVAKMGAKLGTGAPARDPLQYVQFGETDFAFLRRVADDHGMFVRTVETTPEVRAGFDDQGLELKWARDLLALKATTRTVPYGTAGAAHRPEEKRDHRFRNVRKAPTWLDGAQRLTTVATRLAEKASTQSGGYMHDLPFRSPKLTDARRALEAESERALGGAVSVSGESNNIRVRAGDTVTLVESTFRLATQGKVGVTKVVHRFDGHLYSNTFEATPWSTFTNLVRPDREMAHGVVTGVVVDNVDPVQMGRVRVRFRWNDEGEESRWTRMASAYSGNGRGLFFLPEIGDEVVVAFEMGDPERPIVIGALWNGADLAPSLEQNNAKRLVTRTGNTVQLFDHDDDERIEIFTPDGKCWVQLSNNKGNPLITIRSEGDLAFEAKNEIRFTCKTMLQDISSSSQRKIGGNDVHVANGAISAVAGGKHAIEGQDVVIHASKNVDSSAGMINTTIGSMVHIQPPGKVVMPSGASAEKAKDTVFKKQERPKKAAGRTSADPKGR
jgi:uncharacterized protein involved in type VI secretion and phage assembly